MMHTATSTSLARTSTAAVQLLELQSVEVINQFERAVMRHLDRAPIAELVRIGQMAQRLGGSAWRIECKAHAKLLEREHAKRGRGNKDSEGTGVKAAAFAAAELRGCHPRTILRDAQIYRELLQNGGSNTTDIEEKTFYLIALRAHHPQKALRRMAKMKRKRPDFSTRDAEMLVEDLNAGRTPRAELAVTDEVLNHLDRVSLTIKRNFINHAPKEELVTRYYTDWRDDIDWERERLRHDKKELKKAIFAAYRHRQVRTIEIFAEELSRSREEIESAINEMIAEGIFEWVQEGGRKEGQKGFMKRYLRLKSDPLGSYYKAPQSGTNYEPPRGHDPDEEDEEL